jgi:hypothetical protein
LPQGLASRCFSFARQLLIKTEVISPCALRIALSEKLTKADFHCLAQQVEPMITQCGQIRLLIDLSGFNGWESYAAFETRASFIKNHHRNVERIAVIAGHDWQHWVVDMARMFLYPEARAFDKSREDEAQRWALGLA